MKIHLISRIRNEADIIADSIRHWRGFVTGKIVIYDDCSTDNTRSIIREMPDNITLIEGKTHHKDRDYANYWCREQALAIIRKVARPGDWVVCADADERLEFDWDSLTSIPAKFKGIAVRLFDYYITPKDAGKGWKARQWIGPEYRDIVMIWRHHPAIRYDQPSQRVPTFPAPQRLFLQSGFCKHYGKARSVKHWEDKCNYYSGSQFSAQPKMVRKWLFRKGKAVKRNYKSDFGLPLIKWEDKEEKGVKLTPAIHEREFK